MKFEKVKVGNLCELITKGTTPTTLGYQFTDSGISFVKVESITDDGQIDPNKLAFIEPATHEALKRSQLKSGDILFTIAGTIGRVGKVPTSILPANTNQAVALLRPNPESLNGDFLLYALRKQVNEGRVASGVVQAVQANFSLGSIRELELMLPKSVADQRKVVSSLCLIDAKIDINRRINQTLEAMAQAIFKSWFVDFDPVKARIAAIAQGQDPLRAAMRAISGKTDAELDQMPREHHDQLAATAALFPDAMEESELGDVPKGWEVAAFGDVAVQGKGSVNPANAANQIFTHYSLPAFDVAQLPMREAGESIKSNKTPVPSNSVLVSKLNPHIPRIWLVGNAGENAICSTEFIVWEPKRPANSVFVYCLASSSEFNSAMRQLVTGTSNSHQRVKPEQITNIRVIATHNDAIRTFSESTSPLMENLLRHRLQSKTLADLRDILLPKLLSGVLSVDNLTEGNVQ